MKRSTLVALIVLGAALVLTLFTLLANRGTPVDDIAKEIKSHDAESPAITTTIATKVPEDALLLASSTDVENMDKWWKFFSNLNYYDPGLPSDLDEDLMPEEIMYAAFPQENEEDGTFDISSALYIQVEGRAEEFQDWIISQRLKELEDRDIPELEELEEGEFPPSYTLPIIADEDFLILPSDAESYIDLLDYIYDDKGKEIESEGVTGNEEWDEISRINDSVLWFDAGEYVDFFLDKAPETTRDGTKEILTLVSGYQNETTFLGTSKDHGASWSGVFPTGGFDTDKIDLEEAEKKVANSIDGSTDSISVVQDEGLLPLTSVISASNQIGGSSDGNSTQTFGEVRPTQVNHPVSAFVPEGDFKSSIAFSPQVWSSLYRGITDYEEIAYVTLDITESNSAKLSFTFYDELEDKTPSENEDSLDEDEANQEEGSKDEE